MSGRSSRSTEVMTAWRRPMRAIERATRAGSSGSFQVGLPVLTLQKPQRRVQVSPRIMNVAVPRSQHSPTFGQAASWQTVCRFSERISSRQVAVALAAGRRHLEPRRLALAQRAHVGAEDAQHVHPAGVRRASGWRSRRAPARGSARSPAGAAERSRRCRGARARPGAGGARGRAQKRVRQRAPEAASSARGTRAPAPSSLACTEVMLDVGQAAGERPRRTARGRCSTLTAKPCVVTPRCTCTPIEAILRSCTHTPV